jgi:3-oxoacyl-[acyl-carrier protein] reductase
MKEKKYGRFVNIISTSVKVPIPNLGVSNTIRGAMASWSKSLANEVAPFGITVNNVLPGYTETPRLEALALATSQRQNKSIDAVKSQWMTATPAGRFGSPFEIAYAIAFLASESAGFITGVNLPVDGGRTPCL